MNKGDKVVVHVPGYKIFHGTILTGRICGYSKSSYRVLPNNKKHPQTINRHFIKLERELFE